MPEPVTSKPFTHLISNVLVALIGIYFVVNAIVVTTCAGYGMGSCAFLRDAAQPFGTIPAISRPVEVLLAKGNTERAALVAGLYAFGWLSGLVVLGAMIAFASTICLRTSDEERRQTKRMIEKAVEERFQYSRNVLGPSGRPESRHSFFGGGVIVVVGGAMASFGYIFWGFYSFDKWSAYSNMVHVRDRDFYLMSIGWVFALTFAMLFIIGVIQRFIFRDDPPAKPRS